MGRRGTKFSEGNYYHIYNRGCNKEPIFRSSENYFYLLRLLKEKLKIADVSPISYSLMPNHYHFLLRQDGDREISKMIQSLFNSYTKAFNKRYSRSGTLFEGPFKSICVDDEAYLIHLCRYIHRNPLEAGLVRSIEEWEFSNYLEWIGRRNGTLVDMDFVGQYFQDGNEYKRFVLEYEPSPRQTDGLDRYLFV